MSMPQSTPVPAGPAELSMDDSLADELKKRLEFAHSQLDVHERLVHEARRTIEACNQALSVLEPQPAMAPPLTNR